MTAPDTMAAVERASVLRFLGATGTVTGSRFLVEGGGARVLVDCGLYQGLKKLRLRNWEPFPVAPASIDAVALSHAHVDHSGYLPGLVRQGFAGPVFATPATAALCEIVLRDSARLHEEDAAFANRAGFSKHRPALPLFDRDDAEKALSLLRPVHFDTPTTLAGEISATFRHAGHILGSASVRLDIAGRRSVLFSGDLGRPVHPLLRPPQGAEAADAIVVESTYGDREHVDEDPDEVLADVVSRTAERGGVVLIPAFAVDRTEVLLIHLKRLAEAGRIPRLPVYLDSPMAQAALEVYRRAVAEGSSELRPEIRADDDPFDPGGLIETRSVASSRELVADDGPAIVLSASGMATGGRVLHHLERRLPDPRCTVALTGFQAVGTRGRRILEGERRVKLLGRYVPVRAEIADLTGFSVHADRSELLAWLAGAPEAPDCCYIVHGEARPAEALRGEVEARLGWNSVVPEFGEAVRVEAR